MLRLCRSSHDGMEDITWHFCDQSRLQRFLGFVPLPWRRRPPSRLLVPVSLSQNGANVNVDVDLASGVVFAETAGGGGALFLFNDSVGGSTITNMVATLNGVTVSVPGTLGIHQYAYPRRRLWDVHRLRRMHGSNQLHSRIGSNDR